MLESSYRLTSSAPSRFPTRQHGSGPHRGVAAAGRVSSGAGRRWAETEAPRPGRSRVLLVDDHALNLVALEALLEQLAAELRCLLEQHPAGAPP